MLLGYLILCVFNLFLGFITYLPFFLKKINADLLKNFSRNVIFLRKISTKIWELFSTNRQITLPQSDLNVTSKRPTFLKIVLTVTSFVATATVTTKENSFLKKRSSKFLLILKVTTCRIDGEYCSCALNGINSVIKLDCVEQKNKDFMENLTETKEKYIFKELVELKLENKLIKNISNSNVKHLLSSYMIDLKINYCQIESINKGIFNLMLMLKILSLSNNEIHSIEKNSFFTEPFESNIVELYLSDNKLQIIQRDVFNGLLRLEKLFIDKNQIEEIQANSFDNLVSLKEIQMHSNKIKIIKSFTFNELHTLEFVRLDINQITKIEKNVFNNMKRPKILHLQSNYIDLLDNEIFLEQTELETLYLYQNNIKTIDTIPFNKLYSLKILHLFSNKLRSIKFGNFIDLQSLVELRLDKNEIGSFEANTFIGLEELVVLDLSANKIQKLINGAFNSLRLLEKIDLHLNDINQIETRTFMDLESLKYLNLDSNQIFTLKNVQFNLKLVELKLRYNMLTDISEINSTSLKSLFVSNNRIQEIDSISNLPNLQYLDLSQNRLISLKKESFLGLKLVKHVNLSFNKLDLKNGFSYFKEQTLLETLDLSFNEIKYLDTNQTFLNLIELKTLNLSNNILKTIDPFIFGHLSKLNELNLASNNLSLLREGCFFNLGNLKILKLSSNQISSIDFLKSKRNDLSNLEVIDLEFNKIVNISKNDFVYNPNLTALNLNSNPIKSIPENSLKSLKVSNTSLDSLSIFADIKELDLSYLNVSILNIKLFDKIEWMNLGHSKINCSFGIFLNNLTRYVDFSFNEFKWNDIDFKFGTALETLILRKTNLNDTEKINLQDLTNLIYLDLSSNNLRIICHELFSNVRNLEYLDLSENSLEEFYLTLKKLKYLNLENNQIKWINNILVDFSSIEIVRMGNNLIQNYPSFEMSQIGSETFYAFDLKQNQIQTITYFSFMFGKLKMASFDSNNISLIEDDAFLNCRSLEYLSISNNSLTNIKENNFHFLFSLIHLNLSQNEIDFIENNSFRNLNKLKLLDLNYNHLKTIENDLFFGLTNLNDLYLLSSIRLKFSNQSFSHLPNISKIVLDESLIDANKCLFMFNLQRDIQRNVSNKYIFYKSINLITIDFRLNESLLLKSKCDLILNLFQFKIHFNLKTDYENEKFFDKCQKILIKRENSFNQNKKRCLPMFEFNENNEENSEFSPPFLNDLSRVDYLTSLFIIFLTVMLIFTALFFIFKYELFTKLTFKQRKYQDRKIYIENKIRENRRQQTIIQQNCSKIQKKISNLNKVMHKNEDDILVLEETLKELLRKKEIILIKQETTFNN